MSRTRHFTRHYAEMLVAMVAGMVVLGMLAEGLLQMAGSSTNALIEDAPALVLAGMAVSMTVPMVAWMRYRGHGWRPCNEMAGAMVLSTLGVIGLLGSGLVVDFGVLMTIEHVVMLPAMLVAMLLRLDEYTGAVHALGKLAAVEHAA